MKKRVYVYPIAVAGLVVLFTSLNASAANTHGAYEVWKETETWYMAGIDVSSGLDYLDITDERTGQESLYAVGWPTGLDHLSYDGSAWSKEAIAPAAGIEYRAVGSINEASQFAAARAAGGIDLYKKENGTWTLDQSMQAASSGIVYTGMTGKVVGTRADGGIDLYYYGSSWQRLPIVGTESSFYNDIDSAVDVSNSDSSRYYVAGADGGVSIMTVTLSFTGGAHYEASFVDIAPTQGIVYTSVSTVYNASSTLYAARADGGIDKIYVWQGNWTVVPLSPTAGEMFNGVSAHRDFFDTVFGVQGGPPTTCSQVISEGYQLEADMNGDCYVDWTDFGTFASDWQKCTDPDTPGCEYVAE